MHDNYDVYEALYFNSKMNQVLALGRGQYGYSAT